MHSCHFCDLGILHGHHVRLRNENFVAEDENNEEEDLQDLTNLEDDEEGEEVEFVYGIRMPPIPEDMQPLECVVLIHGIMMDNGTPTITAMGSEGMTPWLAAGMMTVEIQRLTMGYTMSAVDDIFEDEDDEDDE